MEFAKYAESKGFDAVWQADSRLVRDAVVPMAAFAAVTERIKIGSGVVDCWTRNPARLGVDVLDARRPGSRPGHPRHRGMVGSVGGEGRHPAGPPAPSDARSRHRRAGPSAQRDRHLRR